MTDVVATAAEAARAARAPHVVIERAAAFLDAHGLGEGPVRTAPIGGGDGSVVSFVLERGDERYVLRRPPLPPSTHDMVREARLQLALAPRASDCHPSWRSAPGATSSG